METYLAQYKHHLQTLGYSESLQRNLPLYLQEFLTQLRERGTCHIEDIEPHHIATHYEYLSTRPNKNTGGGLSSSMINHHLYAIRIFLNYHEQTGTISQNPISGLSFPRTENKQRETLTIQEVKQLYEETEYYRERAIIGIFYGCGLRRSEGVALNVKDISFKSSVLYVREGKGKKRRAVPVGETILQDFKDYLYKERFAPNGELAFITNRIGNRTSGSSYNKVLKELVEKAGIQKDITLHCLRHSIATQLLENGMSIEYVRDFLGHKHLDATQIYTRISNRRLRKL